MKYNLYDMVAHTIMSKEALVIVEGKEDRKIYQSMANMLGLDIKVMQVNLFEDHAAGCDNVIKCITKLQIKFEERSENINRILGIIDRDIRPYKKRLPHEIDYTQLKGLFTLKYYSIETYFTTVNNLKKLIAKITYTNQDEIDQERINFVVQNIANRLDILYYISLEALKNACIEDYKGIIGYNQEKVTEHKYQDFLWTQLENKQVDLDDFANQNNISINDIKLICKGKWYLHHFVYRAFHQIKQLKELCRDKFNLCQSCDVGNFEDCLYDLKNNYKGSNINYLYNDLLNFIDEEECNDILNALIQLKSN